MSQFDYLFTPFKIGNVTVKNRIVFLPHFNALCNEDGMPSERDAYYFAERAKGGAGLIIMYAIAATRSGKMSERFIHGWDPKIIPALSKYADLVHEHGSKIFGQINHGGHTTLVNPPQLLMAPTQMPEPSSPFNTKEMELEDIQEVIEGFAKTALHFKQAGFDGVEIKVAHDGLLRSFVSEYFNRRTDQYGGSFENRLRLPMEIIQAIRNEVGNDFPLGIRLCLDEFTAWGYDLEYGIELAKAFEETGQVTYINTDAGTFSSFYMEIPPASVPAGFAVYMGAALKEVINLPIIAFGRINDPIQAEKVLADGHADLVGMARALIADPELPNKALQGEVEDIRNCIACNDGCIYQVMQDKAIRCIHNPAVGKERELGIGTLLQADKKKSIVVVGGGAAGLKVSEIAALRGHKVTLIEKNDKLGGQVLLGSKLPFRDQFQGVTSHLIKRVQSLGVEIMYNTEADVNTVMNLNPDAIIIATGSRPLGLDIPGADQENVYNVYDVIEGNAEVGDRVLFIDYNGHYKAAGVVELLATQDKHVNVITPMSFVGENLEPGNRVMLYQRIMAMDVEMTPHYEVTAIEGDSATIKNCYTEEEVTIDGYDTFVYANHNSSIAELYFALKGKCPEVYRVGDSVSPRMIEQVIWEAEELGRAL